jgi:Adenylyl/Guanylyl and SMODS C-terminal sensor domain/Cyclic GMP-AMP synthase DncV-like, nucleotidyltransferase domain
MFDYSEQIEAFRQERVRLSSTFKEKLLGHRKANRDRLISRLPEYIKGVKIGEGSFKPQGSVAVGTVIQTKFTDEEYDIDDGLVMERSQLKKDNGDEMTSTEVREAVRDALKDKRFSRQPKLCANCVRVFYAEEDEEKHHVDFPVYRVWTDDNEETYRELASESEWVASDPTQVNVWFSETVEDRNAKKEGWGTQLRHLIQLLKRFCRSRSDWLELLPNGMKLTMLVAECQPPYESRIDLAFRALLANLEDRLERTKVIRNLAHPDQPMITRSENDANVQALLDKVKEALEQIESLDAKENDNEKAARRVWDWVFKSDGFFADYDASKEKKAVAESGKIEVHSRFDVAWRTPPPWPVVIKHSVFLTGRWAISEHGVTWQNFPNDSPPLDKHLYLRFYGTTDTAKPYQVFWQVVNTGAEAQAKNCLRGQIVESTSAGAGGLQSSTAPSTKEERTLYTGMHWVECFIVKSGVCVARSGPFVVNIR